MLKHSLAILIATAVPAMAADNVLSSHKVQFEHESFICGELKAASGKVVRFIHSTPPAKYVPEFEPAATDPLAKSWDITYRIICDGAMRPPITARLHHKRY